MMQWGPLGFTEPQPSFLMTKTAKTSHLLYAKGISFRITQ